MKELGEFCTILSIIFNRFRNLNANHILNKLIDKKRKIRAIKHLKMVSNMEFQSFIISKK